jgi:hypothetical protein
MSHPRPLLPVSAEAERRYRHHSNLPQRIRSVFAMAAHRTSFAPLPLLPPVVQNPTFLIFDPRGISVGAFLELKIPKSEGHLLKPGKAPPPSRA